MENIACDVGLVLHVHSSSAADGAYCPGLSLCHESCEKVNRAVGIYVGFRLLSRKWLVVDEEHEPDHKNNSKAEVIFLKSSTDNQGLCCL